MKDMNKLLGVIIMTVCAAWVPSRGAPEQGSAAPGAGTTALVPAGEKTSDTAPVAATPANAVAEKSASDGRAKTEGGSSAGVRESDTELIPVPALVTPIAPGKELITMAVDDVPLQDVVRMFTRVSGANIISTPSNLQGKVTVSLQDVEWRSALSSILDMYNLTIFEKTPASGIFSVIPKPPGTAEPLIAQTIILNYASVSNVASVVYPLLGKEGTLAVSPSANALIIRSSAAMLNEIRKVISEIDLPRAQVYIEAKFLELSDSAIKDLGINWQVLQGYSIGVGGMQASYEAKRDKTLKNDNSLQQTDSRSHNDVTSARYDSSGMPYEEETTVIQYDQNGNPISTTTKKTPTRAVDDTIAQSFDVTRSLQNNFDKTVADIRTAVLSADDFRVILSALKQMDGVSVVSNPKIIVANEQTAQIHIGENVPNIKGTVTPGQQGQANTTTYALDERKPYFELGVSLDVTPTINNPSNITVKITPKLSRNAGEKVSPDGNSYPIESTKTINTVFSLESGKTAAIGGLTETSDGDKTTKIPLLGDIPLIGKYLFSHTHKERTQKETIIFVTVGIAPPRSIGRNDGLPEDAELVLRHMAEKQAAKSKRAAAEASATPAVQPPPVPKPPAAP